MNDAQIITEIKQGHDINNNLLLLWDRHNGFINKACNKYKGQAERDDLQQESFLILYETINKFDEEQGAKFSTYFYTSLNNGLHRYANNSQLVRVPEATAITAAQMNDFIKRFADEQGRQPTTTEKRAYMKYILNKNSISDEMRERATAAKNTISIYTPIGDDLTIGDTLEDTAQIIEEAERRADREEMSKALYRAIDGLKEEQRQILLMQCKDGLSGPEIAQATGYKYGKVKSIQTAGMQKLKHCKETKKLKEYSEIYLSACSIRNVSVSQFNTTWTSATEAEALRRLNI